MAAVPVLAVTGGTGQETGEGDLALKPAAGAATAAGCPATQHVKRKYRAVIKLGKDESVY